MQTQLQISFLHQMAPIPAIEDDVRHWVAATLRDAGAHHLAANYVEVEQIVRDLLSK